MCNFTPSASTQQAMSDRTVQAIGEMVHAAVKHFDPDHTGPVEFTVCGPNPIDIDTNNDPRTPDDDEEEFFYAQHSF